MTNKLSPSEAVRRWGVNSFYYKTTPDAEFKQLQRVMDDDGVWYPTYWKNGDWSGYALDESDREPGDLPDDTKPRMDRAGEDLALKLVLLFGAIALTCVLILGYSP